MASAQASSVSPASDQFVVGFIGTGIRTTAALIPQFKFNKASCIAALCDVYKPNLEQAAALVGGNVDTYCAYGRVLDRKDIEVVVVATPDHWHCPIVIEDCEARKDICLEKPVSTDIAMCLKAVSTAPKHNRVVQVGLMQQTRLAITRGAAGRMMLRGSECIMEIPANILRDLRFAWRVLRNSPGYAAVAVVTLGLGIAASTTVFSWIDTVLLRPITGVRDAHELVALESIAPDGGRLGQCTHPDFRAFQQGLTVASGVVASHTSLFTIGSSDHPGRALGEVVSANFFTVLGVKPFLGRLFLPEEDRDARGAYPLAVISHRLWTTQFGADPGIVGRTVRINSHPLTIVGVTAPDFRGMFGGAALDVWVPLSMILQMGALNTWADDDWNARFLNVIVRLKPGVTIGQAREEARVIAARIAADHADTHKGIGARLVPLWQASYGLQGTLREPLYLLMVVCVLVLVIVCANVANLLMAREVSRQSEFGVRMALGASQGRVVQQLLVEVLLLAGAGAIFGALLAGWLGESLYRVLPSVESSIRAALEPLLHVEPRANVLAFTVLTSQRGRPHNPLAGSFHRPRGPRRNAKRGRAQWDLWDPFAPRPGGARGA
ncbi:MAG: ABC transporter permease [Bryobacteraceae bacterium]